MEFTETPLKGAYILKLSPISDNRGSFVRLFAKEELKKIGHTEEIVHINHSVNKQKGTIRGMHYQLPPHSEVKIIRCIKGAVFDVIIDLRKNSPTFLKWHGEILSRDRMNMIYIPKGFAHGFQALEDDCELIYLHTNVYQAASERGIRHDDPLIKINWPLPSTQISDRDKSFPLLNKDFGGIK